MPSHHILVLVLQFWPGYCLRGRICNDTPIFAINLPACAGSLGILSSGMENTKISYEETAGNHCSFRLSRLE
jgi:hypothetical protein